MSGIGLAYKTPEQESASRLDAGARAVTQPPAQAGIGLAKAPDPGVLTAANQPDVMNDGGPEVMAPAPDPAPPSPEPAPAPAAQKPLIDFHENPLGAIGLVLSSVAAGYNGTESPVAALKKEQMERQAFEYKQAGLALEIVDKTSKFVAKLPAGQRAAAIADLDKRFSGALGGHSIAPFLTAATAGNEAETAARMAAIKALNVSPAQMAYFAADPDAAVKFLDSYNTHQASRDTPEQKKADAQATAEGTNAANKDKPITPAEQAQLDISSGNLSVAQRNASTSAASLEETKSQHAFERDQAGKKPMTADQSNAATYADRMHEAEAVLQKHGKELASPKGRTLENVPGGNYAQGKNYQLARQAKLNFLTAVLRKESGAVIGPSEEKTGDQQYFPQPGDSQAVLNQKAANRATAMAGVSRAAGPNYRPPAPIIRYDANGNRIPD